MPMAPGRGHIYVYIYIYRYMSALIYPEHKKKEVETMCVQLLDPVSWYMTTDNDDDGRRTTDDDGRRTITDDDGWTTGDDDVKN